jgi:hypothetical protein
MEQHDLHHLTDIHKGENCKVPMFCLTFSRDFNISSLTSGVPGKQRSAVISSKFEFITLNFELIAEKKKKKKELATNSRIICSSHFKIFASQMSEQKRGEKVKEKKSRQTEIHLK